MAVRDTSAYVLEICDTKTKKKRGYSIPVLLPARVMFIIIIMMIIIIIIINEKRDILKKPRRGPLNLIKLLK